ncbi:hypothetical protein V6N13_007627 [Hibiscus sabdariffa]
MIVASNNIFSIEKINFKEEVEKEEVIARQLIKQSLQTNPMLNAIDVIDDQEETSSLPPIIESEERPQRVKRRPVWMTDYEVTRIDQTEDPLTLFALFSDCDPTVFEETVKELKWQKAMGEEIKDIERNDI